MSENNTSVGQSGEARPVQITPIWQGPESRLTLAEHPDGTVTLMRSGEADCGPSRSCPIPAEALASVASILFGLAIKRAMDSAARGIAAAIAEIKERRA